jgi:translation initiation factor 5A
MEKTVANIKDLKPNSFVLIDNAPCRVEKVQVSTSGKHGHAKVRVEAIGLLDNVRRSILGPSHETVEVPIVVAKKAQVLAVTGDKAQLMDLSDYSQFELEIPKERKNEILPGSEIDYYETMGTKTLKKLK